jgi:DNA-binding transcriptional MerR regulator
MKLINGEEYVNEERAAEMLDIARPTLSSWKSRGLIPYHKPEWSNKSFYKVKDIIEIQTGVKHSSNKEIEAEAKSYILKNKNKLPR